MMAPERKAILLSKFLADELSPAEREELDLAVLADPSLGAVLRALHGIGEASPAGVGEDEERAMLERGLGRLKTFKEGREEVIYVEASRQKVGWNYRWLAAACVLGLIVLGGLRYFRHGDEPGMRSVAKVATVNREVVAKYGTRSYLVLPDSSKLWLNAGSRVSYVDGFADGRRELTLTGEAYFDIRHDPDHPFIVHTGAIDVRVLGTVFNVKAYPNDPTIETTLIQGKVAIDWKNGASKSLVLAPSEKVVVPVRGSYAAGAVAGHVDSGDVAATVIRQPVRPDSLYRTIVETSWVEDKLVFRNEPFSSVAEKLQRWYNIKIKFEDEQYQSVRLSGNFKDQSIGNVMDALRISLGFRYRLEGDHIRIW